MPVSVRVEMDGLETAAAVAAAATADAAQRLETMGRTGELVGAKSVGTELEDALRRLRPTLLADSSHG